MSLVNLHIGFSKAGSTFLKNWFSGHPDIFLGSFKSYDALSTYVEEIDKDSRAKSFVLSNHIFNLFKWSFDEPLDEWMRRPDLEKYQGNMCEMLSNIFPKAKIFFVTRGYSTLLQSFYSEYLKTGGRLSFQEMLNEHNTVFLQKAYNYGYLINLYRAAFGKENVITIPYELLKDSSNVFIKTLEDTFEVNEYSFSFESVNPSLDVKSLYWCRTISNVTFKISRLFGTKMGNSLFSFYTYALLRGYFNFLIKIFKTFSKKQEALNVLPKYLEAFKGQAEVLKSYPHYSQYYAEYLIEGETV
jgi:hypothetical protein